MNINRHIQNLTPHEITIVIDDQTTVIIPPEPIPARVEMEPESTIGHIHYLTPDMKVMYIPVVRTNMKATVTGLPDKVPGRTLIVSKQIVDARPDRDDLLISNGAIRVNGKIIGCRSLAMLRGDLPLRYNDDCYDCTEEDGTTTGGIYCWEPECGWRTWYNTDGNSPTSTLARAQLAEHCMTQHPHHYVPSHHYVP